MAPITKLAIIWIHGLGDRGASWSDLGREIKISVPTKWQYPDAPVARVTCNGGSKMTSWFDVEDIPITKDAKDYPDDISASVKVRDSDSDSFFCFCFFIG
jgi:lysophospholipase-2